MKREISPLESNTLMADNKRKLLLDFIGDAVFTALTCDSLAAISSGRVNDLTLCFLTAGVLGAYAYYNDTLRRANEVINLNNNYTEVYTEEEGMKLIRRK